MAGWRGGAGTAAHLRTTLLRMSSPVPPLLSGLADRHAPMTVNGMGEEEASGRGSKARKKIFLS